MKPAFSFCFIPIFLIVSCAIDSESTMNDSKYSSIIEINEDSYQDQFDMGNFISDVEFVFLKTPNNDLISSVEDIRSFENQYFVHDKSLSRIIVFDYNGNIKSKLQMQGQGPGQYSDISFFDINPKERTIEVFDVQSGKIYKYDFHGNFKRTIKATIICRDFAVSPDGSYLFYSPDELNQFNDISLKPGLIYLSSDGKKAYNILKLGDKAYYPMLSAGKSLIGFRGQFNLFSNYSDTIYTIEGNQVISKLALGYNNKIDERALLNPNFDLTNANFPMLKLRPFMNSEYISYTFLHRGVSKVLFYNRPDKKLNIFRLLINNVNYTPFVFNGKMDRAGQNYICVIDELLIEIFRATLSREDIESSHKIKIQEIVDLFDRNQNPILAIGKLI